VGLVHFSGDAGEGHLVAGNVLAGVAEVHPQVLLAPGDARTLHRLAIREQRLSRLASDHPAQRRSARSLSVALLYQSPYVETVAGSAELIEDALSDFGVAGRDVHIRLLDSSFLLGGHCVQ
jgi:hypothetical protein